MADSGKKVIPDSPSHADYVDIGARPTDWFEAEDPIILFKTWLSGAVDAELNDPNAMSLATVDTQGMPDLRMVLLKDFDERGFVFYTNSDSAKGQQLKDNAVAALCFHWKSMRRQVRVRGTVSPVTDAESDEYFQQRARKSRLAACASDQSRPVADRETMLSRLKDVEAEYEGQDVPRPNHWYGWRVAPQSIEFWQDGAFRVHDRFVFTAQEDGWTKQRLYP